MSRAARLAALAAASAADPVAAMADEWYFLREWFDLLGAMGANCDHRDKVDDVRVGRDASDAGGAWLELSFGRDELDPSDGSENSDDSDDGFLGSVQEWLKKPVVRERLRQTREAILLTSVVAQVDFNSWLRIMSEQLYLELPAHWTVPDESGRQPHIPLQYKLLFDTQNDTEFLDWNAMLRHLLGMQDFTAEYEIALQQVRGVLERRGVAWTSIAPTPLVIRLTFNGHAYVVSDVRGRLLRLNEAVQRTQRLERKAANTGSCLTVAALEIDLVRAEFHDHVIEALIAVLQAGVRVQYLRLPPLRNQLPSFATWATLVRLLLGVDTDHHGRLTSVQHVVVPAQYAGVFHFAPFCAALAVARGVDVVEFEGAKHPDGTPAFGPEGAAYRDHTWRWLSLALLSRASQSSVTRLILDGERPLERDSTVIEEMIQSASPMATLYNASYSNGELPPVPAAADDTSAPIVIPKWTIFRLYDGDRGEADCQTSRDLAGQRLATHPTTGDALAFVPGFGFCVVEAPEPSPKRAKSSPTTEALPVGSSLDSVVLKSDHRLPLEVAALEKFLQIIGPRLRSLGFTIHRTVSPIVDATLRTMLASCPNLRSLAISGARLESLDAFEESYASGGGSPLTSLSLADVVVPEEAARAFVQRLADNGTATAQTLERLHWNVWTEDPEALRRVIVRSDFKEVLAQNTTLTHLTNLALTMDSFNGDTLHGKRIPGRSRRQRQQLMAFLGAMRASVYALDELVRRRVWDFAEEQRHRCVVGGWS